MNFIDRTVGFFSPQRGLKRARARAAMEIVASYEGAQTGRRTEGWITAGGSANAEIQGASGRTRNRVRDLVRNNCHLRKAVRIFQNNAVATGIIPMADTGDTGLNKIIDSEFKSWAKYCDADGQLDFYGIQQLIARTERISGECIVRFRPNREAGDVPLQLQVLEPDYIDGSRQYYADNDGKYTILGVQFDQNGKRIGYWLFSRHPGEIVGTSLKESLISQIVPASEVLHVYYKERPGQVRGITDYSAVITNLRDLDDYGDAERVRKKTEACLAAIVTSPGSMEETPPLGNPSISTNAARDQIEEFEPGMVEYLDPGEDIKFNTPQASGGYREYKVTELHEIATGAGVMYEQMSGDLSAVNYSSYRAGHLEFRGDVESYRNLLLVPMALEPIWRKFIDYLVLTDVIGETNYGVTWTPPPFQSIDPEKDERATNMAVRSGRKTWRASVVEAGGDPDRQMDEIETTNKELDRRGMILDIDPRNVNDRGQLHGQAAEDTGAPAPPDSK
jgi:lambda family phage portal protein